MIRLMVVEATGLLDGGLRAALADAPDLQVLAELANEGNVLGLAARQRPDVMVIDLDVPADPVWLVRELVERQPRCAVVLLTGRRTSRALQRTLHARVAGFLDRDLRPADMVTLLRLVAAGQRVLDPAAALSALNPGLNPLSSREREVLQAAAEGLQSKEIARRLYLAPGTVRNHVSAILRKTGTRSRWEAVRKAGESGWI